MVNYENGKLYKIVCNTTGLVYIGSTCQKSITQRLAQHKCDYKLYQQGKFNYLTSFKTLENENYDIILLEKYPCKDMMELHQRERFYIENNECVNKQIPSRTKQQYIEDTKENKKINDKEYYEKNKETISKINKEYRQNNKEIIKERKLKYYQNNIELISFKAKEYYEANKEKIIKRQNEKVKCECGCEISKCNEIRHKKSLKHQEYINNISTII